MWNKLAQIVYAQVIKSEKIDMMEIDMNMNSTCKRKNQYIWI